jgi:hypothetical protein
MVGDGVADCRVSLHQAPYDLHGLVGGVIEHLDIQLLARIIQLTNAVNQPLGYVALIEHRKLHRNPGQFFEMSGRFCRPLLSILVIEVDQDVAMQTVRGQQNQHNEVRNQQGNIESIGVVKPLKRPVEKVLANVLTKPLGGGKRCQARSQ